MMLDHLWLLVGEAKLWVVYYMLEMKAVCSKMMLHVVLKLIISCHFQNQQKKK